MSGGQKRYKIRRHCLAFPLPWRLWVDGQVWSDYWTQAEAMKTANRLIQRDRAKARAARKVRV